MNKLRTQADNRPRVHIWPARDRLPVQYSIGATGARFHAEDAFDAFACAIDRFGIVPMVIIIEPVS